jgi:hypothetical protein
MICSKHVYDLEITVAMVPMRVLQFSLGRERSQDRFCNGNVIFE